MLTKLELRKWSCGAGRCNPGQRRGRLQHLPSVATAGGCGPCFQTAEFLSTHWHSQSLNRALPMHQRGLRQKNKPHGVLMSHFLLKKVHQWWTDKMSYQLWEMIKSSNCPTFSELPAKTANSCIITAVKCKEDFISPFDISIKDWCVSSTQGHSENHCQSQTVREGL